MKIQSDAYSLALDNNTDTSDNNLEKSNPPVYYIVSGKTRQQVDKTTWYECRDIFYKIKAGRSVVPMTYDGYLPVDGLDGDIRVN